MTEPILTLPKPKIDYRAKDLELYSVWKASGSKQDMSKLVHHLAPLIYTEVARSSGSLPVAALQGEGKLWTIKAIKAFDPNQGVALGTHVANYLQRVRRLNYKYAQSARMPENQVLKFHEYNTALSQLQDELNREPTDEELAKKIGWSKPQTVKFKNSLYADLYQGLQEHDSEYSRYSDSSMLMKHLMEQLSPDEKFILENKKALSAVELAEKLGVNTNRLNYLQKKLVEKIQKLKHELKL